MPTATVTATSHRQLQTIADTIHSSKRILVVTGAGISTNSGIPDFRSTHGLYNQVKARYPSTVTSNLSQGKDLFDSVLFSDPTTTSIFYTFLAELRNKVLDVPDTTPTHKFIRTLAETGRLLRCYTQNIDGLEGREGLATDLKLGKGTNRKRKRCSLAEISGGEAPSVITAPPRGCQVVQLHGELDTLRCMHCQGKCEYDDEKVQSLMDGMAPDCPSCLEKDKERREKGKRGTRVGGLRPNIVLYGEEHPQGDLIGQISTADISAKPDMMIIFGTSLKVHGLKKLVKAFAASIHARYAPSTTTKKRGDGGSGDDQQQEEIQIPRVIFVNNQPAANSVWKDVIDAWVDMDCDGFVAEVKKRRPAVWERQERIEAGFRRAVEVQIQAGAGGEGEKNFSSSGSGKGGRVVKNPHAFSTTTKNNNSNNNNMSMKSNPSSLKNNTKKSQPKDVESDKENGSNSSSGSSSSTATRRTNLSSSPGKKNRSVAVTSSPAKMSSPKKLNLPFSPRNPPGTPQHSKSSLPLHLNPAPQTPKHRKTPLPTPPSSSKAVSVARGTAMARRRYELTLDTSPTNSPTKTPSRRGVEKGDVGGGGGGGGGGDGATGTGRYRGRNRSRSPSMSPLSPCPSALEMEFEFEYFSPLWSLTQEGQEEREGKGGVVKRRKVVSGGGGGGSGSALHPRKQGNMLQAVVIHTPRRGGCGVGGGAKSKYIDGGDVEQEEKEVEELGGGVEVEGVDEEKEEEEKEEEEEGDGIEAQQQLKKEAALAREMSVSPSPLPQQQLQQQRWGRSTKTTTTTTTTTILTPTPENVNTNSTSIPQQKQQTRQSARLAPQPPPPQTKAVEALVVRPEKVFREGERRSVRVRAAAV